MFRDEILNEMIIIVSHNLEIRINILCIKLKKERLKFRCKITISFVIKLTTEGNFSTLR
jgi:hypothetical protein